MPSAKLRFEALIATSRASPHSEKLQEVEGAFQDALEESQGLSIVTKHLYQELLGFLAWSGQSEQIQSRLKEMRLGGFPADQVTYGIIINAMASSSFASLASSFFRQAEQEGIPLTLPLCNAMLKASGSAGDLQAAEVAGGWNDGRDLFFEEVIPFPSKKIKKEGSLGGIEDRETWINSRSTATMLRPAEAEPFANLGCLFKERLSLCGNSLSLSHFGFPQVSKIHSFIRRSWRRSTVHR